MEDFLRIPIQIGRDEIIPEYAKEHGKSLVPKWNYEWDILSDDDLICYFKGVVMLEEFLFPGGVGLGSATSTKFIYRTIQERHLDDEVKKKQKAAAHAERLRQKEIRDKELGFK